MGHRRFESIRALLINGLEVLLVKMNSFMQAWLLLLSSILIILRE